MGGEGGGAGISTAVNCLLSVLPFNLEGQNTRTVNESNLACDPKTIVEGRGVRMSDHGVLGKTALDKFLMGEKKQSCESGHLHIPPRLPIAQSTYKYSFVH